MLFRSLLKLGRSSWNDATDGDIAAALWTEDDGTTASMQAYLQRWGADCCGSMAQTRGSHSGSCAQCHGNASKPMGVNCYSSESAFHADLFSPLSGGLPVGTVCPDGQYTFAYGCGEAFARYFSHSDVGSDICVQYRALCCEEASNMCKADGDFNGMAMASGIDVTCNQLSIYLLSKFSSNGSMAWSNVTCSDVATTTWVGGNDEVLSMQAHLQRYGAGCCGCIGQTRCLDDGSNM